MGPRVAFIFALLALTACPGGGSQDAGTMTVELGTGSLDWEPITPEQDLVLVAGPQGGHHFIVNARAQGLVPGDPEHPGQTGNPQTQFSVFDEDGLQVDLQFPPYVLGYVVGGGGWYVLPSGRILQVEESAVPQLYGSRVRIGVHVEDVLGAAGSDERWVHVIEDPNLPDGDAGVDAALDTADAGIDAAQ